MKSSRSKLSVIIVSYNVRYFLEQCLHSVYEAIPPMEKRYGTGCVEVFVVNNASVDGTSMMVRQKFPQVRLIDNERNEGFQKANNQAIELSTGEYVLLLNPDTVVEPETFVRTVAFMDANPDAGALGVKMIDGKGRYWPESKRSFPTPSVSFYKMFGLARLFPRSRTFGRYHLTYLDPDQVHSVEVLSGAFMLIRKQVLDQIGLLEEAFFMYGDDIDLSWRIIKAGYKNYYYPHTKIIHYKGESTRKGRLNYMALFYRAMILFVKKHYAGSQARFMIFLLKVAILFRATLSIGKYLISHVAGPIMDLIIFSMGLWGLTQAWSYWQYRTFAYHEEVIQWLIPVYGAIWALALAINGYHRYPHTFSKLFRGTLLAMVLLLILYAVLPEQYRYSRAVVLFSPLVVVPLAILSRAAYHWWRHRNGWFYREPIRRILWIGKPGHAHLLSEIYQRNRIPHQIIGYLGPDSDSSYHLGHPEQIADAVHIHNANEIVFFQEDISMDRVFEWITQLGHANISFKIIPIDSRFLIGSDLQVAHGKYLALNVDIAPSIQWNERIFQVVLSVLLLLAYPFLWHRLQSSTTFFHNLWSVVRGTAVWTGPAPHAILPTPRIAISSSPHSFFSRLIRSIQWLWTHADRLG